MTGLIKKDMYCLKEHIKEFLIVTISVIVIGVLFIISARYGNVAKAVVEIKAENGFSDEAVYSFFKAAIWLILLIPVCYVSVIVECFKEDKKAGFFKSMMCFPLSGKKMVGSRYISCMMFFGVSVASSLLAGFFVSLATDAYSFSELVRYVFMFSALLLMYMSFVLFFIYFLGVEKADLIQCVPFVILLAAAFGFIYKKLSAAAEVEWDTLLVQLEKTISNFITEKGIICFLIGLGCMALSFLGSCSVLKQRKGNI